MAVQYHISVISLLFHIHGYGHVSTTTNQDERIRDEKALCKGDSQAPVKQDMNGTQNSSMCRVKRQRISFKQQEATMMQRYLLSVLGRQTRDSETLIHITGHTENLALPPLLSQCKRSVFSFSCNPSRQCCSDIAMWL